MPSDRVDFFAGYRVATKLTAYGQVYLVPTPLRDFRWLVGGYNTLRGIAKNLRDDATLRERVAGSLVRIGRRDDDKVPTALKQQIGYGAMVLTPDAVLDHTGERVSGKKTDTDTVNAKRAAEAKIMGKPIDSVEQSGLDYRYSDEFQNLLTYWEKKTPECHHLVEDNQLRALGVSNKTGNGPLDHANLPCVLLAAEFHQKYITPILEPTRLVDNVVLSKAERSAFYQKLVRVYGSLYERNGTILLPLHKLAGRILTEAGKRI